MSTTDLCFAILASNTESVKEILCEGVDVNARHVQGGTPLHVAASAGRRGIAKILIKHGAHIDIRDGKGRTPLHVAAAYAHTRTTKALLTAKATIDLQETLHGSTPLHVAAVHECPDLLQLLIEHKANVDILDYKGRRPLHTAIDKGREVSVDMLLRAGGSQIVFKRDENELTALGMAVYHGRIGMILYLCNHEMVDVNKKFTLHDTRTALTLACALDTEDALERVQALLDCSRLKIDESMDCCGIQRITALTVAVDTGRLALTKLLLKHGADANHVYDIGLIPLIVTAAARGNPKILRALIAAGADVNSRDAGGTSALDAAIFYQKPACENVLRIELSKQTSLVDEGDEAARLAADERRRRVEERDDAERKAAAERAQEEREERHRAALERKAAAKPATKTLLPARSPSPPRSPLPPRSPSPPRPPPPRPTPSKPQTKTKPGRNTGFLPPMSRADRAEVALPRLSLSLADFVPATVEARPTPSKTTSPPKAAKSPQASEILPSLEPLRTIFLVVDGLNVGRSEGFSDPEDLMREHVTKRVREGVHGKTCSSNKIEALFEHIDAANKRDDVSYTILCVIPEHFVFGGRCGKLFAFQYEKLLAAEIRSRLVITPAGVDDDLFGLKLLREKAATGEAYIISNDCFKEHNVDDILKGRHVRLAWAQNKPILLPPEGRQLPGL